MPDAQRARILAVASAGVIIVLLYALGALSLYLRARYLGSDAASPNPTPWVRTEDPPPSDTPASETPLSETPTPTPTLYPTLTPDPGEGAPTPRAGGGSNGATACTKGMVEGQRLWTPTRGA